MKKDWCKTIIKVGGIAALSIGSLASVAVWNGQNRGTVVVSNVSELRNAVMSSRAGDVIVVSEVGSPYHLDEMTRMSRVAYLYVTNSLTIKGRTGRAEDVVLVGSTNRLVYINSIGCSLNGLTFANGNCINNMATTNEPRESLWGGAIYLCLKNNECIITNCVFTNNFASRGGAIALASKEIDTSSTIVDCKFIGNKASSYGGAMYNGGIAYDCEFLCNESATNGGAVVNGRIVNFMGRENKAKNGSICYGGEVLDSTIADYGDDGTNRFFDCYMDRCRIHATNGIVFSGYCDVRNTLISDGDNFILTKNLKPLASTNNPQIICSTIVSNNSYSLAVPYSSMTDYARLNLYYDLFYGNIYSSDKKMIVNWDYVTNDCYKTIYMTKGQMSAAYGWQGNAYTNWVVEIYDTIEVDRERLTMIKGHIQYDSPAYIALGDDFSYTYAQYYYAYGWDGYSDFVMYTKTKNNSVSSLSQYLKAAATTNLTWEAYYRSLGWKGDSDYIDIASGNSECDMKQKDRSACGTIYGCIINPDSTIDLSEFDNCCFYSPTNGINPMFSLGTDVANPYSIERQSPAFHGNYSMYFEYPTEIPITNNHESAWMEESKDLRGLQRLYGEGLDIGAYQAVSREY